MNRLILIYLFLLILNLSVRAQDAKFFTPKLSYKGDVITNFSGGDKRTTQLMGLLEGGLTFESDSARLWKGGILNFEVISTHGKGISGTTLHDMQGIVSIEAGNNALLIWELWYHQQLGRFGIRTGFQNVNNDFMLQNYTDNFSGSSYGVFPTLALNYSLPNYPVGGLGISFSYELNKNWRLVSSLFNGRVAEIDDSNRYDMRWQLNLKRDGVLSISELKYTSDSEESPLNLFGLGLVYHNKDFASIKNDTKSYNNNYTFYTFGEHDFYRTSNKTAGVFLQASYALKKQKHGLRLFVNGSCAKWLFLSLSHRHSRHRSVATILSGGHDRRRIDQKQIGKYD